MNPAKQNIVAIIIRYDGLLQRYARIIINNEQVAAQLVRDVFEEYYTQAQKVPPQQLRSFLKNHTMTACCQWLLAQVRKS